MTLNWVYSMRLNDNTESGKKVLTTCNSRYSTSTIIMVVANQPGYEHTFGTNYKFTADKFYWHWCHCR